MRMFLVHVVHLVFFYKGEVMLYIYLENTDYHTECFVVINNQIFLDPIVKRVNWKKHEAAVGKNRSGPSGETNVRQEIGNFANYGLASVQNSTPNGQWMLEQQGTVSTSHTHGFGLP